MSTKLLKPGELAERWGISLRTLGRLDELHRVKIGKSVRFRLADVEQYEDEHNGTRWAQR